MEENDSFYTRLDGRIAAIEEAWVRLKAGWDAERLQALYKRVCEISEGSHRLSLFQLNEGAFSLEVYLSSFVDAPTPPSTEQITEIEGLVRGLQVVAGEAKQPTATPGAQPTQCSRSIFALAQASSPVIELTDAIQSHGCQVSVFNSVEQMLDAMNAELPALIVTDTGQLDRLAPLTEARQRLSSKEALDIPLVFISDQSQLSTRIAAVRAGASAYFVTPLDVTAIANQMATLSEANKETPFRVTVVEDDPAQAEFAATILRRAGMEVDLVTDPMAVVDALHQFQPDLILMDIYMPEVNGLELTRIIRDFNEFVTTPIVFLSGERDASKQLDALSVGGDDFIAKPIEPRRLISVVTHRIRRSRRLHAALSGGHRSRDAVTGLLTHKLIMSHIAEVLEGGSSGPENNALLYLTPEHSDALQATIGIGGLDALIAESGDRLKTVLAPHDQAGRWGDHGLLILLRRDTPESLQDAADTLQHELSRDMATDSAEPVQFCAGLYALQRTDENIETAIQQAMQACFTNTSSTSAYEQPTAADFPPPTPIRPPNATDEMAELLREALRESSFGVYYQPLLDLQTQGSENYEILIALPGPEGETLTWRKLSEPARKAGLQTELDRWVLCRALDILIERINSGRHTQIFVRQSLTTATDPEHPVWLAEELKKRQVRGTGLVLDYALTDLSQDVRAAHRNRSALEALGVQLTISRFVAKPAAYKILRYLNADYVRVARKLLKADRQTISNLIAEAHQLDARVIVSHVDDPRSIDLHWSSGADYLQGNFIQRPLEDMDYDFSQVVI